MKKLFSRLLNCCRVDTFFRMLNKKRLLIIAYHSICHSDDGPPLFTHLPVDVFERQLQFFKKHYNVISLNELIVCLKEKQAFPERAVLFTFDDGFMNNYKYAFPLLKKYNLPAAIFLTVDYIGTEKLLWFDELYLLTKQALESDSGVIENIFGRNGLPDNITELYPFLSEKLKRLTYEECQNKISSFRSRIDPDFDLVGKKFRLLDWDQVHEMKDSGLIEFGVHTATHRILSELPTDEWEREIVDPKAKLSKILDCEISSFCYPNGIPDVDFTKDHEDYLSKAGYVCAFSMEEWL